jgi:hypothetical protein
MSNASGQTLASWQNWQAVNSRLFSQPSPQKKQILSESFSVILDAIFGAVF